MLIAPRLGRSGALRYRHPVLRVNLMLQSSPGLAGPGGNGEARPQAENRVLGSQRGLGWSGYCIVQAKVRIAPASEWDRRQGRQRGKDVERRNRKRHIRGPPLGAIGFTAFYRAEAFTHNRGWPPATYLATLAAHLQTPSDPIRPHQTPSGATGRIRSRRRTQQRHPTLSQRVTSSSAPFCLFAEDGIVTADR